MAESGVEAKAAKSLLIHKYCRRHTSTFLFGWKYKLKYKKHKYKISKTPIQKKTLQECETALTLQYQTFFLVIVFLTSCLFRFLSFWPCVLFMFLLFVLFIFCPFDFVSFWFVVFSTFYLFDLLSFKFVVFSTFCLFLLCVFWIFVFLNVFDCLTFLSVWLQWRSKTWNFAYIQISSPKQLFSINLQLWLLLYSNF